MEKIKTIIGCDDRFRCGKRKVSPKKTELMPQLDMFAVGKLDRWNTHSNLCLLEVRNRQLSFNTTSSNAHVNL